MSNSVNIKVDTSSFLKFIIGQYGPLTAIVELLQNAIDACVAIGVQKPVHVLFLNGMMLVCDPGIGMNQEQVKHVLENVGNSQKLNIRKFAGKRGTGLIGGLACGKATAFYTRKGADLFTKFVLRRDALEKGDIAVEIVENVLLPKSVPSQYANYSTVVAVEMPSALITFTVKELIDALLNKYNRLLVESGVPVWIYGPLGECHIVTPREFAGERLGEWRLVDGLIRLYHQADGRSPNLVVCPEEKPFDIPWRKIRAQMKVQDIYLDDFLVELLDQVDGIIILRELDTNQDRSGYQLAGLQRLADALNAWMEMHGVKVYDRVIDRRKHDQTNRIKDIAQALLDDLVALPTLQEKLQAMNIGLTGEAAPDRGIHGNGKVSTTPSPTVSRKKDYNTAPERDRPVQKPQTPALSKLRVVFAPTTATGYRWMYQESIHTILIVTNHPDYIQVSSFKNPNWTERYAEKCILSALHAIVDGNAYNDASRRSIAEIILGLQIKNDVFEARSKQGQKISDGRAAKRLNK
ncbi:MAG: ATP-binding protein [bacterium]